MHGCTQYLPILVLKRRRLASPNQNTTYTQKVSIFLEHTKVSILLALERYIRASTIVNMYGTLLLRSRNMWKPGNNHRGSSDVTCAAQNESNGDVLLCYILRFSASTETWDILLL